MIFDEKNPEETRGKLRAAFCQRGGIPTPSIACDFFAEFARRRFPKGQSDGYLLEWAGRFARGSEFHAADLGSRQLLLDIMLEGTGDGNAPHLTEENARKFCEGRFPDEQMEARADLRRKYGE